jgi:hypothetical protein
MKCMSSIQKASREMSRGTIIYDGGPMFGDYEQELYEKDLTILRLHDKLSLQIPNMSYHEGLQKKVLMIVTEDLEDAKMCREQNQK